MAFPQIPGLNYGGLPAPAPAPTPKTATSSPNGGYFSSAQFPGFSNSSPGGGGSLGAPHGIPPSNPGNAPGYHPPNPYLSDPGYQQSLLAQTQGDASIQAMLNKEIAQQLLGYGDASLAGQAGYRLSPNDLAAIRQNYLAGNSTKARLDHAHSLQQQAVINGLAGRGLLFSGETGYQQGQADRTYGNQVYDAQQAVLQAIQGYRQQALQQEQALQQQVISALEAAYQNYVNSGQAG